MPVWLTGILAQVAEFFIQKLIAWGIREAEQSASEKKVDQHAKDVAKGEADAKTPADMDKADGDLLGS